MKNTFYISIFAVLLIGFNSCKEEKLSTYDGKRALYFPKYDPDDYHILDSAYVSFSHYPGKDILEIPFQVSLIGDLLDEDTEYAVSVVTKDTSPTPWGYTTADPDSYELLPLTFHKGVSSDILTVRIKKVGLGDKEVLLALRIVENEHFTIGFAGQHIIKLAFNNIVSQPKWWVDDIIDVFFGEYSLKKYQTIILAAAENGFTFTTAEGLELTKIWEIALWTQDYIKENGTKDEDGEDMIIPAY